MPLLFTLLTMASFAVALPADDGAAKLGTDAFERLARQTANRSRHLSGHQAERFMDLVPRPAGDLESDSLLARLRSDFEFFRALDALHRANVGEELRLRLLEFDPAAREHIARVMRMYVEAERRGSIDEELASAGTGCFAGEMRVSTPRGAVELHGLRAGDEIFSYDFAKLELVRGRVARIASGHARYGVLREHGKAISVTPGQRFWARYVGFRAVEELDAADRLAKLANFRLVTPEDTDLEIVLRGRYDVIRGRVANVYELVLEKGCNTYFVEGLLVRDGKFD